MQLQYRDKTTLLEGHLSPAAPGFIFNYCDVGLSTPYF